MCVIVWNKVTNHHWEGSSKAPHLGCYCQDETEVDNTSNTSIVRSCGTLIVIYNGSDRHAWLKFRTKEITTGLQATGTDADGLQVYAGQLGLP